MITIDQNNRVKFNNHVDYCVGTGRLGLALTEEYLKELEFVQKMIGFSFIRGHGLFSDDVSIYHEYEENGEIESQYSKSNMLVNGNNTNPHENTRSFSSNVLEMIKGAIVNGYSEEETYALLKDYGVKLSNYEREINLGDLDAQYMLLIETPQDKVNHVLNNMDNIVLTIPTSQAPDWMVNELSTTYQN